MAAEIGSAAAAVEERLLAHGERFSYFQAVRLLRLFGKTRDVPADSLRVRPKLSLGFPETDIDSIESLEGGGYRITANFFGLYGVASPLPTYYTEDLFEEEREGRHATRDFLDVIHFAVYPLLFDAWRKHRLQDRVVEDSDAGMLSLLYAFMGLHDKGLRGSVADSEGMLRYAGLFNQRPRSALGLKILLADAFSPAKVDVVCCTVRQVAIPDDQRLQLGQQANRLGEDAYLGSHIDDYSGSLTLRLSGLSGELFHALLPGTAENERLRALTRFYLVDPLEISVELELRHEDARPSRTLSSLDASDASSLGAVSPYWSRLGLDTWLMAGQSHQATRVQFWL